MFASVNVYTKKHSLKELLNKKHTYHLDSRRTKRLETAIRLNDNASIDRAFLIDKNHKAGKEIHFVTLNGIIFIFNAKTFRFITVFIARPNQVLRLYKECNLNCDETILNKCKEYVNKGLNK